MREIWKDIKGFEGKYQVSNIGRVRSLAWMAWNGKAFHNKKGRTLALSINMGYHSVGLHNNGINTSHLVHRLVVTAFIGDIPNGMTVNHKDGDKLNNHVSNLEICTLSDNLRHAHRTGLMNKKGENHHKSKFTDLEVLEMRNLFNSWDGTIADFGKKHYQNKRYNTIYYVLFVGWEHLN